MLKQKKLHAIFSSSILLSLAASGFAQQKGLILNEQEYFAMPGLEVMVFHDYYPEGHQGGITIIQNGVRVASNGDLRLEPAPGQWQPIPKVGQRSVDRANLLVSVPCSYPNPDFNRKGFNPIIYPDLNLQYTVHVKAEGASVRISVDMDKELPEDWIGKVGFNLELFPGELFGKSYEHVPGLNVGGWHDAGDYDLRVESQAETVRILALIYENFRVDYDETTIDEQNRVVELHQPDGKPDVLQQIEHGVLSILGGYKNLGRLYRGIICSHLRQYVTLGDGSTMTDNRYYNAKLAENELTKDESGKFDDRYVFTEENPGREFFVAGCLAAAARVLKNYDNHLGDECLRVAEELWESAKNAEGVFPAKIEALTELMLATHKRSYQAQLIELLPEIQKHMSRLGWLMARLLPVMNDNRFRQSVTDGIRSYGEQLKKDLSESPFGVPYRPNIWGAGWDIQEFGVRQFYLHQAWPEIFPKENVLNALNFVLGCHPGPNTASFASGVGAKSMTVAYGFNRADWSHIPGGVVSGTGLIRPDFPELKEWPFLWQQAEYVIGGGAENFMFLVLAAKHVL